MGYQQWAMVYVAYVGYCLWAMGLDEGKNMSYGWWMWDGMGYGLCVMG